MRMVPVAEDFLLHCAEGLGGRNHRQNFAIPHKRLIKLSHQHWGVAVPRQVERESPNTIIIPGQLVEPLPV